MDREWNDSQPIYRQIRDRVVAMILDDVLKAYQQLVDEQLVESKRGRGMFINTGARQLLLQNERQKFLAEEWPKVSATIQRLGLTPQELLDAAANPPSATPAHEPTKQEEEPNS